MSSNFRNSISTASFIHFTSHFQRSPACARSNLLVHNSTPKLESITSRVDYYHRRPETHAPFNKRAHHYSPTIFSTHLTAFLNELRVRYTMLLLDGCCSHQYLRVVKVKFFRFSQPLIASAVIVSTHSTQVVSVVIHCVYVALEYIIPGRWLILC